MKYIKKAVSIAIPALFGLMVILCLYGALAGKPVTVMGYGLSHVMSESMEPTIMTGGYTVFQKVEPEELQVGDIIVFHNARFGMGENTLYCHRIVSISEDGMIGTWGDNNDSADPYRTPASDVVGRVVWVFNDLGGVSADTVVSAVAILLVAGVFSAGAILNRSRGKKAKSG